MKERIKKYLATTPKKKKVMDAFIVLYSLLTVGVFLFFLIKYPSVPGGKGLWFYIVCLFLLFAIAGVLLLYKERKLKPILIISGTIALAFLIRVFFADFVSGDYEYFLKGWLTAYRETGIPGAFRSTISNYVPLYNYFLIAFSRMDFVYDLYMIKLLSAIFDVLCAFAVMLIVAKISGKPLNKYLFAFILVVPAFFIESPAWGQCDSIYCFFGLMGFYYALKKKSLLAFIFFGISLAIKAQAIVLLPIAIIMLFAKDTDGKRYLDWRYMFIAVAPYFILNCLPLFFGKSFWLTYGIYFRQVNETAAPISSAPGISILFKELIPTGSPTPPAQIAAICAFLVLAISTMALLVFFAIKHTRNHAISKYDCAWLGFCTMFCTLLLMPKIFDRYYYLALFFAIILCAANPSRANVLTILALHLPVAVTMICGCFWVFLPPHQYYLVAGMIGIFIYYCYTFKVKYLPKERRAENAPRKNT